MGVMTITRIDVLSVPVADQDRAKDFYVNTLGFEAQADQPMGPDRRWVQVGPKGAETSITLVTWFDTMPAGSLTGLVLVSDDVDADCASLQGLGVQIEGPQATPWGRQAILRDPDGNGLVLLQR
jgi:catechol 2,3-dioxygenase-like lactoylglutathione lyase family enzyme